MAAAMTAAITIALTLYAFTTKTDFTYYGALFWIFGMSLFLFGIFFWGFNYEAFRILYSILGIILYSFYLIYDTQLLMGGKKYELSMDDYVIAALLIYIDIIYIFLYVLSLLGKKWSVIWFFENLIWKKIWNFYLLEICIFLFFIGFLF